MSNWGVGACALALLVAIVLIGITSSRNQQFLESGAAVHSEETASSPVAECDSYEVDTIPLESARPAYYITYESIDGDTDEPISKFGGQPNWIGDPQWPLSRSLGEQMQFIGQIALDTELFPDSQSQMAYVFATDNLRDDMLLLETWDPSMGENAVILQPAGLPSVDVVDKATGPSVSDEGWSAYVAHGARFTDPAFTPGAEKSGWTDEQWVAEEPLFADKIGGTPKFLQGDEFPLCGAASTLILQFSKEFINLGDGGTAYAFMNREGTEGGFLTQSH